MLRTGALLSNPAGRGPAPGMHTRLTCSWLVACCLIALLGWDRVSPALAHVPRAPVPGVSRPRSCQPRLPSNECWPGVTHPLHRSSVSVRRLQTGDIAPVRPISLLSHLPTLLPRAVYPALPRSVVFFHERFYIRPRAPARGAPTLI